jgi:1,4-alpha-glucan branching enzyme
VSVPRRPDPKVEAIVEARHGDPFSFLGMHPTPGGVCVRAMLPAAQEMAVIDSATGKVAAKGVRVHPDGFFVANVADRKEPFRYRLRISRGAVEQEFDDIYRFPPVLGELDTYLLAEGNHLASYRKLGAHPLVHEGVCTPAGRQRLSVPGQGRHPSATANHLSSHHLSPKLG